MKTIKITEEQLKYYTEAKDVLPDYTVLWLDDVRSPEKYLASNKTSKTFTRNADFYNRLAKEYSAKFIWVRNLEEFQNYIVKNGLPDLVSFDFDLGAGIPKGSECAKWLKKYCVENGINLPKYYIHSANNNAQTLIPNEIGSETRLNELVYVNGVKGKKANLTYDNGAHKHHMDNISKMDNIRTDKMDTLNSDTYEIPLKGGIMSYNITSIKGTEVMHYFKRYFENKKTTITINNDDYELTMKHEEFKNFMTTFKKKVWAVISHCVREYENAGEEFIPNGISILPVRSSSNFNDKMAEILSGTMINGLPCQVINRELFVKDMRNLEKDTDFINKNKDYYSGKYYSDDDKNRGDNNSTVEQNVDAEINKNKAINELRWCAQMLDKASTDLIQLYYQYNNILKTNNPDRIRKYEEKLVKAYRQYHGCYEYLLKHLTNSYTDANGETKSIYRSSIIVPIKGTKGPSVEQRTEAIWSVVKKYLRGVKSDITGEPFKPIPIYQYKELPFQIKNITDPIRMGMRNIYNPNENEELVKQEVEKTKGTVFVVFDDNISGGATLGDICYQAKQLGIEHIIPITFGKMLQKNSDGGGIKINMPYSYNLNEKQQ